MRHQLCPHCKHKMIFYNRKDAEKCLRSIKRKHRYEGKVYSCPYTNKGWFHIGRDFDKTIKKRGLMRDGRRFAKYLDYRIQSRGLCEQLKNGLIEQGEFDRAHKLLGDQYRRW